MKINREGIGENEIEENCCPNGVPIEVWSWLGKVVNFVLPG